jgi:hypothetical protein
LAFALLLPYKAQLKASVHLGLLLLAGFSTHRRYQSHVREGWSKERHCGLSVERLVMVARRLGHGGQLPAAISGMLLGRCAKGGQSEVISSLHKKVERLARMFKRQIGLPVGCPDDRPRHHIAQGMPADRAQHLAG